MARTRATTSPWTCSRYWPRKRPTPACGESDERPPVPRIRPAGARGDPRDMPAGSVLCRPERADELSGIRCGGRHPRCCRSHRLPYYSRAVRVCGSDTFATRSVVGHQDALRRNGARASRARDSGASYFPERYDVRATVTEEVHGYLRRLAASSRVASVTSLWRVMYEPELGIGTDEHGV